jgi:ABC-2 type transport system ATP-binding protein
VTTVLHDPDLIILDEPFSGLDPVNANLIRDEIFRLSAEGRTIIFSTHRMEQVEEICREIILVNQGRKILDGPVRKIREDFKEGLFRIGFADKVQPEHLAIHIFQVVSGTDRELVVRKSEDTTTNDILSYFIHKGLPIQSFNEILPTLNEIFIRQVGDTPVSRAFGDGGTSAVARGTNPTQA